MGNNFTNINQMNNDMMTRYLPVYYTTLYKDNNVNTKSNSTTRFWNNLYQGRMVGKSNLLKCFGSN
jgi:hypothetical protein